MIVHAPERHAWRMAESGFLGAHGDCRQHGDWLFFANNLWTEGLGFDSRKHLLQERLAAENSGSLHVVMRIVRADGVPYDGQARCARRL
ncbi:MAG: hypothetical protein ACFCVA_12995 [Gammaproteobacteria bacterium]